MTSNKITVRELAAELGVTIPSFDYGTATDWLVSLDQTLTPRELPAGDDTELDDDYANLIRENWLPAAPAATAELRHQLAAGELRHRLAAANEARDRCERAYRSMSRDFTEVNLRNREMIEKVSRMADENVALAGNCGRLAAERDSARKGNAARARTIRDLSEDLAETRRENDLLIQERDKLLHEVDTRAAEAVKLEEMLESERLISSALASAQEMGFTNQPMTMMDRRELAQ